MEHRIGATPEDKIKRLSPGILVDFEDAWYDAVDPTHFWMQWRNRVFLDLIASLQIGDAPLRALEIGCGNGIARHLIEKSTPWTVDAADVNPLALEMASPGRGETLLYNIFDRLPDRVGRYDAVILFDVLEHIENSTPFLDAALAHLRPGGYAFLNVPALQTFYSIFDKIMGHHRRYNRKTLLSEIAPFPVQLRNCRYWGFLLLPVLAARTVLMGLTRKDGADAKRIAQDGVKPPNLITKVMLNTLRRVETSLVKTPPLGTSIMLAVEKCAASRGPK